MSLSLDRMVYLVTVGLGKTKDPSFTRDDAIELLNLALWDLEDRFDFKVKETVLSTSLVEDQSDYSVSDSDLGVTLDAIRSVCVIDSEGHRNKLKRINRDWLDVNKDDDDAGLPERWIREGTTLTVYPTPSSGEDGLTMEIAITKGVPDLVDDTNETTRLPRNWDELVVQGGIWRGKLIYQGDYQNATLGANFQESRARMIESKNEKEAPDRYAGLDVIDDFPEV